MTTAATSVQTSSTALIIVGETIVHVTYRCMPAPEGQWQIPYASFDEEYLQCKGSNRDPELALQGVLPIAKYWMRSTGQTPLICTAVASQQVGSSTLIPNGLNLVCDNTSLGSRYVPPIVMRILRLPQPRIGGTSRGARPHLRIDRLGSRQLGDELPEVDRALTKALEAIPTTAGRRACLVRVMTPTFFGWNDGEVLAGINRIQAALKTHDVELMLDVRPIPADLQILNRSTVVSSTIQRLRDLTNDQTSSPREVVEKSFWRLTPARGLLCFSSFGKPDGALLCLRDSQDPSIGHLYGTEVARPQNEDFQDAGQVAGGDAFVAAFATEFFRDPAINSGAAEKTVAERALGAASVALTLASEQRLGSSVHPDNVKPNGRVHGPTSVVDPRGHRLDRIVLAIENIRTGINVPIRWNDTEIIAPDLRQSTDADSSHTDPLRGQLDTLAKLLENWHPHPGRDVLAIFGESRSGKEFPLREVLLRRFRSGKLRPNDIIGPINQFEFLASVKDIASDLAVRRDRPNVLILDEIVEGDSARPLLNLLAEKKPWDPTQQGDFTDTLIVLLSSIGRDRLLTDVHGRLRGFVEFPGLRDRWMELPFTLPRCLNSGIRYWKPPERLAVSFRLMSALLHHDYRPHSEWRDSSYGIQQQNFRAFEDLLAAIYCHARGEDRSDWAEQHDLGRLKLLEEIEQVDLRYSDLPVVLQTFLPSSKSDDSWLIYTLNASLDKKGLSKIAASDGTSIQIKR